MSNRNEKLTFTVQHFACGKKQDIWNQLHLGHENQTTQDDTPDYHNAMVRDIDLLRRVPASSLLVHVIAKTHSSRIRTINWIYSTNIFHDPALEKILNEIPIHTNLAFLTKVFAVPAIINKCIRPLVFRVSFLGHLRSCHISDLKPATVNTLLGCK